ncbi:MAG: hypothetical protein NO076_06935, partial [Sulfolobales archaeon]|nr:hypothetical protein [Sulfolobales archaeon]
ERARERAGNLDEVVREEDYLHMVSLIRQRVDLAEVEDAQEAWEKAKRRVRCILEEFLGVPQASV